MTSLAGDVIGRLSTNAVLLGVFPVAVFGIVASRPSQVSGVCFRPLAKSGWDRIPSPPSIQVRIWK
jgi:hypothetical protein